MRKTGFILGVVAAMIAFATPASAQANSFTVLFEGVEEEPVGTVLEVVNQAVPAEFVGDTCTVTGETENNSSVHLGNDMIVETGTTSAVISDIEAVPGAVISGTASVVMGSTVTISVRFGPDEITSAGILLTFVCEDPPPPTTTTTTTPTTTIAPVVVAPAGGVETGGGGTADTGSSSNVLVLVAIAAAGAVALFGIGRRATSER